MKKSTSLLSFALTLALLIGLALPLVACSPADSGQSSAKTEAAAREAAEAKPEKASSGDVEKSSQNEEDSTTVAGEEKAGENSSKVDESGETPAEAEATAEADVEAEVEATDQESEEPAQGNEDTPAETFVSVLTESPEEAQKHAALTAAKVNGKEMSAAEMNFYLAASFRNNLQMSPFDAHGRKILASAMPQKDGSLLPLRDAVIQSFAEQAPQMRFLVDQAKEKGTELSDEMKKSIEDFFSSLRKDAEAQKADFNEFIASLFGPGITEEQLRSVFTDTYLAVKFQEDTREAYEFTDEEYEKGYEKLKDQLDLFTLRAYTVDVEPQADKAEKENSTSSSEVKPGEASSEVKPGEASGDKDKALEQKDAATSEAVASPEADAPENSEKLSSGESTATDNTASEATTTLSEEEKKAAVEKAAKEAEERHEASLKAANEMKDRIKSEDDFKREILKLADEKEKKSLEEHDPSLIKNVSVEGLPSALRSWLLDPARKEGDVHVIDINQQVMLLYFIKRERPEKPDFSTRHILLMLDQSKDLEEAKAEAQKKVDEILKEYKEKGENEDAFAELAAKYSEDPGSKDKGGLYENVRPGSFIPEYEAWSLDPARKEGDVETIFTDNQAYKGFHIIYFKKVGRPVWKTAVQQALASEKFNAWIKDNKDKMSFETVEEGLAYVLPYDEAAMAESLKKIEDAKKKSEASSAEATSAEANSDEASSSAETSDKEASGKEPSSEEHSSKEKADEKTSDEEPSVEESSSETTSGK